MSLSSKFKFGDKVLIISGNLYDTWTHLYTIYFKIIKTEMDKYKNICLLYIEEHNNIVTDILPTLPKWSELYINEKLFRLDKKKNNSS